MFDSLYSKLSEIIDAHIPSKQLSRRELKIKSKPWITPAIKTSIQIKNKLYKKFLKTKSSYYHTKFKYYRNKINHLLKVSKKNYYNEYFHQSRGNSKRLWKGIKRVLSYKSNQNRIPTKINHNNSETTDPKIIANVFDEYFANIGRELACSILDTETALNQFPKLQPHNSFYLFSTSTTEIEAEIEKLNESKATGPFSIPTRIFKLIKSVISKPLEIVFHTSFATGIVPDKFKIARVFPVFKNGLE